MASTVSAVPTDKDYGSRLGTTHKTGYTATAEFFWNAVDALATLVMIFYGVQRLPSGATLDCMSVLDNGHGMSEAVMNDSLLRLGRNRNIQHGAHSLNGHGVNKASEHLGSETMYLSRTEDGWAVGRIGAAANDLTASNVMMRITIQFATLDEASALDSGEQIFYNNPFCSTGAQLRALLESITHPTGTLVLVGNRHAGTGFAADAAARLLDVERDWTALRTSHLPKAVPVTIDMPELISRAAPPPIVYEQLRARGFVHGLAPGAGVEVYVNDVRVEVAALNPFQREATAAGAVPEVVFSEDGRFAFAAVWAANRETAETGVLFFCDGKNLGLFPGNGGNRTFSPGSTGLSGITFVEHSMNITAGKCAELTAKMEEAGAGAGVAHEAMKAHGAGGGLGRDKQVGLHNMYGGRGLIVSLFAQPGVLKSDDPKEGVVEDGAYRDAVAFAVKEVLRFTAKNPAGDALITKLLAPFQKYRGLTIAEVVECKRAEAAKKTVADAAARRAKAEQDAAVAAAEKTKRQKDMAAAALTAMREADAAKAARAEATKKRREAKAATEREAATKEATRKESERRLRAEVAELRRAARVPAPRGRARDEEESDEHEESGAARGAPRARTAACADCAARTEAHAAQLRDKDAHIERLEAFIRQQGLQVPDLM